MGWLILRILILYNRDLKGKTPERKTRGASFFYAALRFSLVRIMQEHKWATNSQTSKNLKKVEKERCEYCDKKLRSKFLIKCKICSRFIHLICLDPEFKPGQWFCSSCRTNIGQTVETPKFSESLKQLKFPPPTYSNYENSEDQETVETPKSLSKRLKDYRQRAKEQQYFICPFCKHDFSSKHELVS